MRDEAITRIRQLYYEAAVDDRDLTDSEQDELIALRQEIIDERASLGAAVDQIAAALEASNSVKHKKFHATVDLPVLIEVVSTSQEEAEAVADKLFEEAYALISEAVRGWRAGGAWPEGTYLGDRYDDTSVAEA